MTKSISTAQERLNYLLSPQAVRDQSHRILEEARDGKTHFKLHENKLVEVAGLVVRTTKEKYPDLNIPFHSRWGHFRAGGVDRIARAFASIKDPLEKARTCFDLVIPSVLLDAGAGMQWEFEEEGTRYSKSEGLALASLNWFRLVGGKVSSSVLKSVKVEEIAAAFQVRKENPLLGLEGRAKLLVSLGNALEAQGLNRPGQLVDRILEKAGKRIPAEAILREVLFTLGPIWPGRLQLEGVSLGDCWEYAPFNGSENLVPFHKLSQWMTYSLIEPLQMTGVEVFELDALTGLPEYRNGGLFLDSGMISLRDPLEFQKTHLPSEELVIEWRALTVALLDIVAPEVRKLLGKTKADFPLAKMLEGGTWWAGRKLAADLRNDGGPPLKIQTDGTVF